MPVNRCRVSRRFGSAPLEKTHEEDREQNADFLRRARFPQLLQLLLDRRLRRQWDRRPVITLHAFRLRDEEGEGKGEYLQRDEGKEGLVVDCAFAIAVSGKLARTKGGPRTLATRGAVDVGAEVDRTGKDRSRVLEKEPDRQVAAALVLFRVAEDDGLCER